MKNYMGEELQLWIGSGATAHTLACATSLSVNVNADTIDVSCKDTGKFGASIAGKINWDLSTDCLFVTEGEGTGKTYACLEYIIKNFFKTGKQSAIIRRTLSSC